MKKIILLSLCLVGLNSNAASLKACNQYKEDFRYAFNELYKMNNITVNNFFKTKTAKDIIHRSSVDQTKYIALLFRDSNEFYDEFKTLNLEEKKLALNNKLNEEQLNCLID